MQSELTDKQQASLVEMALDGTIVRCGSYSAWFDGRMRQGGPCQNIATWFLQTKSQKFATTAKAGNYYCCQCARVSVSTYNIAITFLPTGQTVDREKVLSIASIRRAMRRISDAWR